MECLKREEDEHKDMHRQSSTQMKMQTKDTIQQYKDSDKELEMIDGLQLFDRNKGMSASNDTARDQDPDGDILSGNNKHITSIQGRKRRRGRRDNKPRLSNNPFLVYSIYF